MKLSLPYEAKPWKLNQAWGVYNPIYKQFGFSLHNGDDYRVSWDGNTRTPFNCTVVNVANQPNGAGLFITVMSDDIFESPYGEHRVMIDYMHLKSTLGVYKGKKFKIGEVLAPQNNTGFSTGPHTHGQYRWVSGDHLNFNVVGENEANNSFNPEPYRNGQYAEDIFKKDIEWQLNKAQLSLIQLLGLYVARLRQQIDWRLK